MVPAHGSAHQLALLIQNQGRFGRYDTAIGMQADRPSIREHVLQDVAQAPAVVLHDAGFDIPLCIGGAVCSPIAKTWGCRDVPSSSQQEEC